MFARLLDHKIGAKDSPVLAAAPDYMKPRLELPMYFRVVIRGRPNLTLIVSAETETRPKVYALHSAETESRPKV